MAGYRPKDADGGRGGSRSEGASGEFFHDRRNPSFIFLKISGAANTLRVIRAFAEPLVGDDRNESRADRREGRIMADDNHHDDFWYRGKVSRRRLIGYGVSAGALGAVMSVPAPWQADFGQAKPYKIGTLQPLS